MSPGQSKNRNSKRNSETKSPQTSTRLAPKKQSRLSFKNQKGPIVNVRKANVEPSKLMYRSNISGLISTVLELELREEHIRQLQKTPFSLMIDAIRVHMLDPKAFKKCDATVCRIIQCYNPNDEKFHIGGAKLPLRNNDIRLIFGVQCGNEKLDFAQGGKGPSDFIQRRNPNVTRISCKVIKDLLGEAMCGHTEQDEQDVAKLLSLYVCAKLFFATTGEHIGWAFVRVIDKLETLKQYDWTATIRNTLIGSLNDMYHRPEKVTGCVVALLFLICEHSNIVTPDRPNVTPRFCRWNIAAAVAKLKLLNFTDEGCVQIHCGKLIGTISECHNLKLNAAKNEANECGRSNMVVEPAQVCEGIVAAVETNDVGGVEASFNCWQVDTPNAGNIEMKDGDNAENKNTATPSSKLKLGTKILPSDEVWPVLFPDLLELSSTPDGEAVGEKQGRLNDELRSCNARIAELESEVKSKDARVRELEKRLETMEQLLGRHAGNMFVDLNSVIVEKDSEIERLSKVVDRLETKISHLEDSLDDFEVHEVTQCVANDGSNQRTPSNGVSGKVSGSEHVTSVESAQHSASPVGKNKHMNTTDIEIVEHEAGIEDLTLDYAHENVNPNVDGSCRPQNEQAAAANVSVREAVVGMDCCEYANAATSASPKITSLVKRVKTKPRREFRLSDYEYPNIFGRQQPTANVRLGKSVEPGVIYSVEDVVVERKTWNGFGMNRRHTVWNMLKDEDKQLLDRMYSLEGDGLIVWNGGHNGIQVHFTDIKDLVQQNSIHGNVIDAYAAMLTEMRKTVSGSAEFVGTTYVYTSVCSDMMRNVSALSRTKYLNVHMKAARGCRYTLFPIYNANHWTVMAHDAESGNWKHYNSMRPRRGVRDDHYNEALKVKEWVVEHHNKFVRPRVTAEGIGAHIFDGTFISVMDCPQQDPESSDCGIFACFIVRQFIRGADVDTTMDGLTPTGLRAAMVDMFLSDPGRGLRGRTL